MRGLLDTDALEGNFQVQRHLRPARLAYLVRNDNYAALTSLIELLCQTWGGASALLIPTSYPDLSIHDSYMDILLRSELDGLTLPPGEKTDQGITEKLKDLTRDIGVRPSVAVSGHPALFIAAARDKEKLRTVNSVTLPQGDPWDINYLIMCGRLPERPNGDLLARAGARDGLRYEDFLTVQREVVSNPSLEDLHNQLHDGCPIGLSRIALTTRRPDSTTYATDGWLAERDALARNIDGDAFVLYEPQNVSDACLLWNLRASHGWPIDLPIGLPYRRKGNGEIDRENLTEIFAEARKIFGGRGFYHRPAFTSESLSLLEVEKVADHLAASHTPISSLPENVLMPSRPASRGTAFSLHFSKGESLISTRTDEDRDWLSASGGRSSYLHLSVQVNDIPAPPARSLCSPWNWLNYRGGGFVSTADKDTFTEVVWPQTWTMFEAVANDHGLRVEESRNGRNAMALTRLVQDVHELRWLGHRGIISLLYTAAASTSMSWWKRRSTEQAQAVANEQEDPVAAMDEFKRLISEVHVSHDAETSGSFGLDDVKKALNGNASAAKSWLTWAENRNVVRRFAQLTCEHCQHKFLVSLKEAAPPLPCRACGLIMRAPYNLHVLPFRFRLAEQLRRSIDDDSIFHALIMRWLISVFRNRPGHLIGAHPGVNFYSGKDLIGEADIVLLFSDGSIVPVEVKRSGRQLTNEEVEKLRKIARLLKSPAIILGSGDTHHACPDATAFDISDGTCRVVTADYWLNPQPRPTLDGRDLPVWNVSDHPVPDLEATEESYTALLTASGKRAFGAEDPVRSLWS